MHSIDEVEEQSGAAYGAADPGRAGALRRLVAEYGGADTAREHAVLGGALLVVYKLSQTPGDLTAALVHLEAAHEAEPTPSRKTNLASALLEAVAIPGRRDAVSVDALRTRAVSLLREALERTEPQGPYWPARATTLLGALLDLAEASGASDTIDECLTLGRLALERARGTTIEAETSNLLGSAYRVAFDRGHPAGDLDEAVRLLREAVTGTPPGHLDLPARASNLGTALMERFDATGANLLDLADAVAYTRLAFEAYEQSEPSWLPAANNYLNALLQRSTHIGDEQDAHEAVRLAHLLLDAVTPDDALYPVFASNTGLAEQNLHHITGDPVLALAAVRHHEAAVAASRPGDPLTAGRISSLAIAYDDVYHHTGDPADLDAALAAGRRAVETSTGPRHEIAAFQSNLGNLQHDRFLLTGRIEDLETCVRSHLEGLRSLPRSHPSTAALLNNAATAFTDRYNRFGDPTDLARAVQALSQSLAATPTGATHRAEREVNLATTLHRMFTVTDDPDALTAAEVCARQALASTNDRALETAAIGTIADIRISRYLYVEATDRDGVLDQVLGALEADVDARAPHDPLYAARLLRTAVIRRILRKGAARERLIEACEAGLRHRPAVTLTAARQLAMIGLEEQVAAFDRGTQGSVMEAAAQIVAEANAYGSAALAMLSAQDSRRAELSWRAEAHGLAAIGAQSRLLLGDATGALSAFETGHGVILGRGIGPSPRTSATSVSVWSTDQGGGAVIGRPDGGAREVLLPVFGAPDVVTAVRALARAAAVGPKRLEVVLQDVLAWLTAAVTAPVCAALDPEEPLVWSAAGLAGLLPYAAAGTTVGEAGERNRNTPVIARHPLRVAPTAQIAGWAEHRARSLEIDWARAWSFTAPLPSALAPLVGAEAEGDAFAATERHLTGRAATLGAATEALPQASLLHIACHATISSIDPLANAISLADDEPWFAQAISESHAPDLRLAVLSACSTAAAGTDHADEGIGLPAAFHLAGAPGVIATLWSVGDGAASTLMQAVATAIRHGTPPPDAFRTAILAQIGASPASSWASFVYSGA